MIQPRLYTIVRSLALSEATQPQEVPYRTGPDTRVSNTPPRTEQGRTAQPCQQTHKTKQMVHGVIIVRKWELYRAIIRYNKDVHNINHILAIWNQTPKNVVPSIKCKKDLMRKVTQFSKFNQKALKTVPNEISRKEKKKNAKRIENEKEFILYDFGLI